MFNIKNKTLIVLLVIILLGGFLRVYKLGEKNFTADEFLGVNTSYGYLQTGEWRRWDFNLNEVLQDKAYFKTFFDFDFWDDGEDTYTRAWAYNWQVAQFLKFFPAKEEWSYRVVGVVWSILTLLAIYLISVRLTGKKTIGLLSAFLWAVSIDSIEFSRKVRMYTMFAPIFLLFAYSVFSFLESKKNIGCNLSKRIKEKTGLNLPLLIPTILFGLLSMHLHLLTGNIAFIFLVYLLVMGVIGAVRSTGYLLDESSSNMDFNNKGSCRKILSNKYSSVLKIFQTLNNHYIIYLVLVLIFGTLFSMKNDVFIRSLGWQDHFSYFEKSFADYSSAILVIILIGIGGWHLVKKGKIKEGVFLSSAYWVIFLSATFLWDRNTGSQYLFFAKPFQVMLLASGIYGLASFLRNNSRQYAGKIFASTIILLLLIVPNYAYFFQDENTYTQTSRSGNPNYRKVFKYVIKKKNADDVLITRNFRNFYWTNQKITVYSLGGERSKKSERKLTLERLQDIMKKHSSGWLVYSSNDESFISKEAREFIKFNLEKVSNSRVRGPISVWRWN